MSTDDPKSRLTRIARAALAALSAVLLSVPGSVPAFASQGSVPDVVQHYVDDPDGLLARLDDLFGVGTGGRGIDFDGTTALGVPSRVFTFTDAWRAGERVEHAVQLENQWAVPVSVTERPVGLAVVWINPADDEPELAEFDRSASAAESVAGVPDEAYLVRESGAGAWFALLGDELTPLVAGTSGLDGPIALERYQDALPAVPAADTAAPEQAPPPADGAQPSLLAPLLVVGAAALAVILALLLPMVWRRRERTVGEVPEDVPEPEPEPEPEPAGVAPKAAGRPAGKPATAPTPPKAAAPAPKGASKPASAAPKAGASKPSAGSKAGGAKKATSAGNQRSASGVPPKTTPRRPRATTKPTTGPEPSGETPA